jgi:hypothetical protein
MKKSNLRSLVAAALLPGLLFALGCEQGPDRPRTYPVTGSVTYSGQPVEGATVSFQGAHNAVGKTDASGGYQLTTFAANDGAPAGQYSVAISKFEGEEGAAGPAVDMMSDEYDQAMAGGGKPKESAGPENLLPAQYAEASKSGLTATVSESGPNNFDFDLQD